LNGRQAACSSRWPNRRELQSPKADVIVLVTDAREGLTVQDRADRRGTAAYGRRVFVAVNKAEGMNPEIAMMNSTSWAWANRTAISAEHGAECTTW